jgi:SAM-dependent methyltransferase
LLHEQGALGEAVAAYREALTLKPDLVRVHSDLGDALAALGDIEGAVDAFRTALELDSDNSNARRGLVAAFHSLTPTHYQPALDHDLEACFAAPTIDPQDLAALTARQLLYKHRIKERWDTEREAALSQLGADALLHTLLRRCVNVDAELERALTALRRERLLAYHESAALPAEQIALITALGVQGFHNEYVFNESAEETAAIEALAGRCDALAARAHPPSSALEARLLLLAMYRPLYALDCAPALAAIALEAWSEPLRELLVRTLIEPREEEAIAPGLTSLGEAKDATSRAVRAQYEEHPYPRWLALPHMERTDLAGHLHRVLPHFRPPAFLDGPVRMLVAGCGTGREPLSIALACEHIEIVALDFSRRSLAYAVRRARALGVENVRFVHADLLALPRLQERFHVIQCIGVLHHMAEPLRGWRVLTERLLPGGLMKIGLYSGRARVLEAAAQAEIRRRGLRPIATDIKAFRTSILYGDDRATLGELGEGEDLYTMSACRDLLFHAQECRFSLAQIRQALDALGLSFLGFELSVPQVAPRYRALFPGDPHMTDLAAWERFERHHPQAFAGMYVFWCQKD